MLTHAPSETVILRPEPASLTRANGHRPSLKTSLRLF